VETYGRRRMTEVAEKKKYDQRIRFRQEEKVPCAVCKELFVRLSDCGRDHCMGCRADRRREDGNP
jgi:hypothetical protein